MNLTKLGCIVSVNVGTPRQVHTGSAAVLTAIYKSAVQGRIALRGNNLEGDRQADLTVHGGRHKAVYAYPQEHYAYWHAKLQQTELPPGMFGENLTTEGITEDQIYIGDRVRIGSAVLQVTQPRMPCYKLGIRFGRPDMVKLFWQSGLSGFYFSVIEEGEIAAGDNIERIAEAVEHVSVADRRVIAHGDVEPGLIAACTRFSPQGRMERTASGAVAYFAFLAFVLTAAGVDSASASVSASPSPAPGNFSSTS